MPITRDQTRRDRALLAGRFPAAFLREGSPEPRRPLKVGIYHDLRAAGLADENGPVTARRLSRALHDYTNGPRYLRALIEAEARVDLAGEPAGEVTEAARAEARKRLEVIGRRQKRGPIVWRETRPGAGR